MLRCALFFAEIYVSDEHFFHSPPPVCFVFTAEAVCQSLRNLLVHPLQAASAAQTPVAFLLWLPIPLHHRHGHRPHYLVHGLPGVVIHSIGFDALNTG